MSYTRVLPRDLFNEANLLKCLGRLWIYLDNTNNKRARFDTEELPEQFMIEQSSADGSIYVDNVGFWIDGNEYLLFRPLNARGFDPLQAVKRHDEDADAVRVFAEYPNETDLSPEFFALIWPNKET